MTAPSFLCIAPCQSIVTDYPVAAAVSPTPKLSQSVGVVVDERLWTITIPKIFTTVV